MLLQRIISEVILVVDMLVCLVLEKYLMLGLTFKMFPLFIVIWANSVREMIVSLSVLVVYCLVLM